MYSSIGYSLVVVENAMVDINVGKAADSAIYVMSFVNMVECGKALISPINTIFRIIASRSLFFLRWAKANGDTN